MNEVLPVESQELQSLRRALGDMAALSSLPAMWVNADEERIASSLADALMRVLDLDGVRVTFSTEAGQTLEVSQLPDDGRVNVSDLLDAAFPDPGAATACDLGPDGVLRGFCTAIGLTGAGRLDAVSGRQELSDSSGALGAHHGRQPSGRSLAEGARRTGASRADRGAQPRAASGGRAQPQARKRTGQTAAAIRAGSRLHGGDARSPARIRTVQSKLLSPDRAARHPGTIRPRGIPRVGRARLL